MNELLYCFITPVHPVDPRDKKRVYTPFRSATEWSALAFENDLADSWHKMARSTAHA